MAESAELNILIETGADFVLPYVIYDNNGDPVDLTGSTITSHLRRYAEDNQYFEFVCTHNGAGGRITIRMAHEVTSQIAYPHGVYDVLVTLSDGITSYPLKGDVEIRHGVTKPIDGSILLIASFAKYSDLPAVGNPNRMYFVRQDGTFYRWNGQNYLYVGTYNGITSIEKIGSSGTDIIGVVDTYRIHFSDGRHYDYNLRNGKKGDKGDKGDITSSEEVLAQLGQFAFMNELDYNSSKLINKPKLKPLAFQDQIDYESDQIINKPESIGDTIQRLRSLFPLLPLPILIAIYLADETLYLGNIGTYDADNECLILPSEQTNGVTFEYIPETETLRITVTGRYLIEDAPSDNNFYARRNGAWVTISSGGSLSLVSYDPENEALVFTDVNS